MLKSLVHGNRSYRRFDQRIALPHDHLLELVELARLSASAANKQPLRFALSSDPAQNARIFPHLAWAGYLNDWAGPAEGERPTGYIVIACDTRVSKQCAHDVGISAQTILLGAVEKGFGGCMIGSVKKDGLRETLSLEAHYEILLVIALGKPAERVVIDPLGPDGDIRYWRDEEGVHHVPKRSLDALILDDRSETRP